MTAQAAIDFLTRTGQICDGTPLSNARQEVRSDYETGFHDTQNPEDHTPLNSRAVFLTGRSTFNFVMHNGSAQ